MVASLGFGFGKLSYEFEVSDLEAGDALEAKGIRVGTTPPRPLSSAPSWTGRCRTGRTGSS